MQIWVFDVIVKNNATQDPKDIEFFFAWEL